MVLRRDFGEEGTQKAEARLFKNTTPFACAPFSFSPKKRFSEQAWKPRFKSGKCKVLIFLRV